MYSYSTFSALLISYYCKLHTFSIYLLIDVCVPKSINNWGVRNIPTDFQVYQTNMQIKLPSISITLIANGVMCMLFILAHLMIAWLCVSLTCVQISDTWSAVLPAGSCKLRCLVTCYTKTLGDFCFWILGIYLITIHFQMFLFVWVGLSTEGVKI